MEFKKNVTKADEFINAADEQREAESAKNKESLGTKLTKEIKVKIKKKFPTYTLSKFIEMALTQEIPHIKNEILVTIHDLAKWHNTSLKEFVRFKMGLSEAPEPLDKREIEHIKNYIIFVTKEVKEKIANIAQSLQLSILTYSQIKIQATYELKDVFSFDELMQFKAEALNYGLELDEYIAMRIRG